MNNQLNRLYKIANKPKRYILGLMSGTSMDGLDMALCSFEGNGSATKVTVTHFKTAAFTDDFRQRIKKVFSKKDAGLEAICLLNPYIGIIFSQLINDVLKEWNISNKDVDIIASHGQTIYHSPQRNRLNNFGPDATLQIGDGDHIAVKTGIITISDFRQKHIAAGGEGAPLAVYGDYLLFSKQAENRIMLNIGGIANFTFLPGSRDADKVFSTDVGTGNTMMDQYIQANYPNLYFDKNADFALRGTANNSLLTALCQHPFFKESFPKTTGPEIFNLDYLQMAQQKSNTSAISKEDVLATLNEFSAITIADAIKSCFTENDDPKIYLSGGGMHNPLLVSKLKDKIPFANFFTTDDLNIKPDAKEAVLFALLANETIAGNPIEFGKKGVPAVCMGKISFPC